DHGARERSGSRELYGRYLAAVALTTHRLYDLQRSGSLSLAERTRLAGEALTASGAYELRYQVLITAPEALEAPVEQAFRCLRTLGDHMSGPPACTDAEWDAAIAAISAAIAGLKRAMRISLAG